MNLEVLRKFATYISKNPPLKLRMIKRIGDNLFKVDISGELFFIDLSRSKSTIFTTKDSLMSAKIYQAPFDKSLQKYCFNAHIINAKIDGNNRILQLFLQSQNSYKTSQIILQIEFTGKNTNLIILDSSFIVLDALHHITNEQSFREVRISKPLLPLPQPIKIPINSDEYEKMELFEILSDNFRKIQAQILQTKIRKSTTLIAQKTKQLKKVLQSLENKELLESSAKKAASFGGLIIQNLYLYPNFKGNSITLDGLEIALPKKARTLSHAAQIFFENSKKLSKKAKNIHLQEQNLMEKIDFYENLFKMIQNVTNLNDLEILNSNFSRDYSQNNSKDSKRTSRAYESFFIEGIKVSFGRSEKENIALLKSARSEDIWLHIRGIPSSHCIIHCGKEKISDIILHKVAGILRGLTKDFRENYTIDYTKRKFVKLVNGANVVYAKEQTLQLKKD